MQFTNKQKQNKKNKAEQQPQQTEINMCMPLCINDHCDLKPYIFLEKQNSMASTAYMAYLTVLQCIMGKFPINYCIAIFNFISEPEAVMAKQGMEQWNF